jgi:hypothetical protein
MHLIIISEVKPSYATTIQSKLKIVTSDAHSNKAKFHPRYKRFSHLACVKHDYDCLVKEFRMTMQGHLLEISSLINWSVHLREKL